MLGCINKNSYVAAMVENHTAWTGAKRVLAGGALAAAAVALAVNPAASSVGDQIDITLGQGTINPDFDFDSFTDFNGSTKTCAGTENVN